MRDFITTDISRCRAKNVLYHPTTGRKSNLITLVSHHHGWVRFQVSDKKLVNHTPDLIQWIIIRVSTGIPGYGLRTEMIRKFFQFPLWKRFQKTGIPEQFFSCKTEISRISFRKFSEKSFQKFPVFETIGTIITYVNTTPVSNTNNIWMDAGR